jgi:protein TonB
MTNKEILQADLLDILFEHRNKLYGAYALRKTYSHRLGIALGVALSTVLLFILMSFINKKDSEKGRRKHDDIVKLTQLVIPPDKQKEPEPPPKEKQKPPTAEVDYQAPKIVEDDKVKEVLPDLNAIDNANISDKNLDGDKPTDIANDKTVSNGDGDAIVKEPERNDAPPLPSRNPSFPGGPAAWLTFLQRYLQAPADVEPGDRIEVQVRFWIDVDGSVSRAEIIKSGGSAFDKEVLRVMKKMPKWEPALQAGRPIAVAYQQPVIFIGQEQ